MADHSQSSSLEALLVRLRPVLSRRAGLAVALWGEAGIGKTHTVRELLRQSPCRSFSFHATTPLAELIRTLPRSVKTPMWAESFLERLMTGEAAESERTSLALGALLTSLAPVILHLEDLHEASLERFELVQLLAAMMLHSHGTALLVTSRHALAEPFESLRVKHLSVDATRRLLEGVAGTNLPEPALGWIHARAGGNPLFTLEFFRHLTRNGSLWNDARSWRWRDPATTELPPTVEALVERLLADALDEGSQEVLIARALLPLTVHQTLWAEVAGVTTETLTRISARLEARGVFKDSAFVYPLYREIGLGVVPSEVRQRCARRALIALERDELSLEPHALSELLEAAQLTEAAALGHLERASTRASARGNAAQGARLLGQAVRYAPPEVRGVLALEAARGLRHIHVQEATRLAEVAVESPAQRREALWLIAELLAGQGQREAAVRTLLRLEAADRAGSVYVAKLVQIHSVARDYRGALGLIREHEALLRDPDPVTAYHMGLVLATAGFTEEAERLAERLAERWLIDPDANLEAQAHLRRILVSVCFIRGDFAGMERYTSEIVELSLRLGDLRLQHQALINRALALRFLGRFADQRQCLEEALRATALLGDPTAQVIAQYNYAALLIEFGEYAKAEDLLLEARDHLRRTDFAGYLSDCEAYLSQLYREWQPPHGKILALKYAREALDTSRRSGDPVWLMRGLHTAARSEAWAGSPARVEELAREASLVAGCSPTFIASRQEATGRGYAAKAMGDSSAALKAFEQAYAIGSDLYAQRIGLELDVLRDDLASARERMMWFAERGLKSGVGEAIRLFPELAKTGNLPAQGDTPTATVRLLVLGAMRWSNGDGEAPLRGQKRKELLALLLEARIAGRPELSRLELINALYPGFEEAESVTGLKSLTYQVRQALGAGCIATTAGGYALGAVTSDAEAFLRDGDTGLWRGAYLEDVEVTVRGESVRDALYTSLQERAHDLLERDPLESARLGRVLLEADPYDQATLRLTLEALRCSRNHRGLQRVYIQAKARLLEVGELLPDTWQAFLEPLAAH